MVKIWAKLITDNKTVKSATIEKPENMDYSLFFGYLCELCEKLDVPAPVLIKTHIFNYAKYNHVKFTKEDFVESFAYDKLVLENIAR